MITKRVKVDGDVESVSVIKADLGVGNRQLIVASGIVLLHKKVDDEKTWRDTISVFLDIYARDIEQSSVFVGLASIANSESHFTFAVDTARVTPDQATGELVLNVDAAVRGEWSSLNRFSYQVVATIVAVNAAITGTISWATSLYDPGSTNADNIGAQLQILANHHEIVPYPDPNINNPTEKLTPQKAGRAVSLTVSGNTAVLTYRIDDPPKGMPLKVTVVPYASFAGGLSRLVARRVAGPDVFTLTVQRPEERVDFEISQSFIPK